MSLDVTSGSEGPSIGCPGGSRFFRNARPGFELGRSSSGSMRPMLLKKSVPSCSVRFSWVVLPLTKAHERLVGQSERSKFSPAARQRHAATFSTTSAMNSHSGKRASSRSSGTSTRTSDLRCAHFALKSSAQHRPGKSTRLSSGRPGELRATAPNGSQINPPGVRRPRYTAPRCAHGCGLPASNGRAPRRHVAGSCRACRR